MTAATRVTTLQIRNTFHRKKKKNTPAVTLNINILSKLSNLQTVCDTPIARIIGCVLMKDLLFIFQFLKKPWSHESSPPPPPRFQPHCLSVCHRVLDIGRRLTFELQCVACTRVNRVMLINLCAQTIKPVFEGHKT